jgi:hypothetical protein
MGKKKNKKCIHGQKNQQNQQKSDEKKRVQNIKEMEKESDFLEKKNTLMRHQSEERKLKMDQEMETLQNEVKKQTLIVAMLTLKQDERRFAPPPTSMYM